MLLSVLSAYAADPQLPTFASVEETEGTDIINGVVSTADDHPETGATILDATMTFGSNSQAVRMFSCSSTLIAPDVVLLAAHCVDPEVYTYGMGDLEDMDVRWTRELDVSEHDGSKKADWPEDAVAAWDWTMHPEWDMRNLNSGKSISQMYDIALLFLDTPVTDVDPGVLITAEEASQIAEGLPVTVVGWGQQIATSGWEQPPEGSYGVKMMGSSSISELGDYEMQIGKVESDVRKCHGDSGGPTFLDVETESPVKARVIGVTSHAYDQSDCDKTGGVDTRVDPYLSWIDEELRSRCEDGTRAWCDEPGVLAPPEPPKEEEVVDGDEDGRRFGACSSAPGLLGLSPALLALAGLRRRR